MPTSCRASNRIYNQRYSRSPKGRAMRRRWQLAHPESLEKRNARWYKYNANHPRDIQAYRTWKKHRKTNVLKTFVDAAKARPCMDCSHQFPAVCMDFDHVRGKKVANVSILVARCRALQVIQDEIAKCDVVCANCHRIRTLERRSSPTLLQVLPEVSVHLPQVPGLQ